MILEAFMHWLFLGFNGKTEVGCGPGYDRVFV